MSDVGDSSSTEDDLTVFQRDELAFSNGEPVPQYHELAVGGPVVPTQYHLYPAAFPDARQENQHPLFYSYFPQPPTSTVASGYDTFIHPTSGEAYAPVGPNATEMQGTISPSLLSNTSYGGNISPPVSPSNMEPGKAKSGRTLSYPSPNNFVSSVPEAISDSYVSLPRPPDLSKKRRRHYNTGSQHVVLAPSSPYQVTESTLDMVIGPMTTGRPTYPEHTPFAPLATSPPHAAQTGVDSGEPSLYFVEPLLPADPMQIQPWPGVPSRTGIPPELQVHYDTVMKFRSGANISIGEYDWALMQFWSTVEEETEGSGDSLSSIEQSDKMGYREDTGNESESSDPVNETGGQAGRINSSNRNHDPSKKRSRYIERECQICHHRLNHQSQMRQHVMDHFSIFPFQCEEEGW
ncbi:hypothetical protein FRC17_010749 [Serendipita sp. 399]|nr:hypothetical protein FRC17_010749 [Serendipita sp. 399]